MLTPDPLLPLANPNFKKRKEFSVKQKCLIVSDVRLVLTQNDSLCEVVIKYVGNCYFTLLLVYVNVKFGFSRQG